MKKNAYPPKHDLYSWIVIRCKQGAMLPAGRLKDDPLSYIKSLPFSWAKLCCLFPDIRIDRLFNSLGNRKIRQLVKRALTSDPAYTAPDFFSYGIIGCPLNIDPRALVAELNTCDQVDLAYIQSGSMVPPYIAAAPQTLAGQGYLLPAPLGINSLYAWGQKGGDGGGRVKFIDLEQGWVRGHNGVAVSTLPSTGINHSDFDDHGIAVLGVIAANAPTEGVIGITPMAKGFVMSQWRMNGFFNTADAIMAAAARLNFGDILLLETQVLDWTFRTRLWPIEIQDAVWQAIRFATALGVIVVEPAGNGNIATGSGCDLGELEIHGKKRLNPTHSDFLDSGAILVGAASSASPHIKLPYSNFGSRVNCFAWGENIKTTGNYPQTSGYSKNSYTTTFGGTSGATAIVAGAAIAIQSIVEAKGKPRLGPAAMRALLSNENYNTASKNGQGNDKIGVMPDLKKIIDHAIS